jgi:hypothetical protein
MNVLFSSSLDGCNKGRVGVEEVDEPFGRVPVVWGWTVSEVVWECVLLVDEMLVDWKVRSSACIHAIKGLSV